MGQFDTNNYIVKVRLKDNVSDERWAPLYKMSPSVKGYKYFVKNNIVISYNPTAERLIRFFIEYGGGILKPEIYNCYEPVSIPFLEDEMSRAIGMLAHPAGCVYLKKPRTAEIMIENKTFSFGWIDGVYTEPQAPLPEYLTIITVFFPKKKNTNLDFIIQLMRDIKEHFGADNGKVYDQATREVIVEE